MNPTVDATLPDVGVTQTPSFWGLLRGECYKALRLRAMIIGAPLAFVPAALLIVYLFTATIIPDNIAHGNPGPFLEQAFSEVLVPVRVFIGLFLIVLTVYIFGQEYQNGTIRVILARGVGRVQLALAKLLAVVGIALVTLAVYLAVAFPMTYLAIIRVNGGAQAFHQLPATFGHDMLLYVVSILISVIATIMMAMAATIYGRSLAFGMGVALMYFPADNVAVRIFDIFANATHNPFWDQLTAYLLGPTLNAMPVELLTGEQTQSSILTVGDGPQVLYDGTHAVMVALFYTVVFAAISFVLMRLRDIHE
jgi:ABC-2 type transport system permease protein